MEVLLILFLFWMVSSAAERRSQKNKRANAPQRQAKKEAAPRRTSPGSFIQDFVDELEAHMSDQQDKRRQTPPPPAPQEVEQGRARYVKQGAQRKKTSSRRTSPRPSPTPPPKGPAAPRQSLADRGSKLQKKESRLQQNLPQRTRRKSRYADRNVHVGLTAEEKRDLGYDKGPGLGLDFGRASIRKGVIWQQILNEPKARSHWK